MAKVQQVFNTFEAGRWLGLSGASVRRAVRSGQLHPQRHRAAGNQRGMTFSRDELKRFVRSWPPARVEPMQTTPAVVSTCHRV